MHGKGNAGMKKNRYGGSAVVAVLGAGVVMGLAGCGPKSLASNATAPSSSPSQSAMPGASASSGMGSGSTGMTAAAGNASGAYQFRTIDDPADPTFNQLLGINGRDTIVGYFGSGAAGHPNKGYNLSRTRAGFEGRNENVPGSVQTQVIGVNDRGVTVGFWSSMNNANQTNDNTGFYSVGGVTRSVRFPTANNATPPVNQLLGVNDANQAVGFYNDAQGNAHGYVYSIAGGRFQPVTVPGAASVTAAGINNRGDVAGFFASSSGTTDGFLRTGRGHVTTLAYPGASMTQATGVNDRDEVVGNYQVGTGSSAVTHGFTWSARHGFKSVDDPNGMNSTVINGVNDAGDLVGFYTDSAGNTDGFAAAPAGQPPFPGLAAMPMLKTPMPSAMPSASMAPSTAPAAPMTKAPSAKPSQSTAPAAPKQTTAPASGGMTPSAQPTSAQPAHW